MVEEVVQGRFAGAAADDVYLRTLKLDQWRVEAGNLASKCQLHPGVGGTDLAREDFSVRITGRAQETQAHQSRLLPFDLFDDDRVGRFRIGLVKHHALVSRAFQDSRE